MLRAGIPVPSGFIVTADAYARFIEQSGLRPKIEAILNSLDVHDSNALQKASRDIEKLIIDTPVPDDIAAEIKRRYREMGEPPVAVRSSATAEDLPEASFAGQQSTFLNVVGADRVVQAVKECWASLFEARAIFYRSENAFEHMKVKIAVPVQRMVQSEFSGVMFTVEPVTSDRSKITVEAIVGLGEGLVSGEISPDMYIVDKATMRIVEKRVAEQDRQLSRTAVGAGKGIADISWQEVPANLRRQPEAQRRRGPEGRRDRQAHRGALRLPAGHRVGEGEPPVLHRPDAPRHDVGGSAGDSAGGCRRESAGFAQRLRGQSRRRFGRGQDHPRPGAD